MRHVIPLAALLALAACGPKYIRDTKVEDTP
jgi:predicted small lipoprotein YifL